MARSLRPETAKQNGAAPAAMGPRPQDPLTQFSRTAHPLGRVAAVPALSLKCTMRADRAEGRNEVRRATVSCPPRWTSAGQRYPEPPMGTAPGASWTHRVDPLRSMLPRAPLVTRRPPRWTRDSPRVGFRQALDRSDFNNTAPESPPVDPVDARANGNAGRKHRFPLARD